MQAIAPIRTREDLDRALARIDEIFDAAPGTRRATNSMCSPISSSCTSPADVPFGYPDPVAAIEFRMEQARLNRRDLIPLIGSSARVGRGARWQARHHDGDGACAAPASRNPRRFSAAGTQQGSRRHRLSEVPAEGDGEAQLDPGYPRPERQRRGTDPRVDGADGSAGGGSRSQPTARTITSGSTPRPTNTRSGRGAGR